MRAGEIRALAERAGIAPGVSVLDLCCGVAGPGRLITRELGCGYLGIDPSASAIDIARERAARPPLPLRGRAGPAAPAGHVRRGAPARDDARVSRQGDAGPGDLRGAHRRRALRLHAGGGPASHRAGAGAHARRRHGLAHSGRGDARAAWSGRGWSSAGRRTGAAPTGPLAEALIDAFAADATAIAARIGRRALDELLASHRLWSEWLATGRVRKIAFVAEKP